MKTVKITVHGRVQGVYFRAYTQKQAIKQGINGYVSNNKNGAVDIIACADQAQLEALIKWCQQGPLLAKVSEVIVTDYTITEILTTFEIR